MVPIKTIVHPPFVLWTSVADKLNLLSPTRSVTFVFRVWTTLIVNFSARIKQNGYFRVLLIILIFSYYQCHIMQGEMARYNIPNIRKNQNNRKEQSDNFNEPGHISVGSEQISVSFSCKGVIWSVNQTFFGGRQFLLSNSITLWPEFN